MFETAATMEQIAKLAGVSQSTVSRVINGRPGPSVRTAQKVNEAIERVGYVPPPIGQRRGVRKHLREALRHRLVALVVLDRGYRVHPELFVQLLSGISTALTDHGLGLIIATHPQRLPSVIRRGMVDGLLLMGSSCGPKLMESIEGLPAVWLTSHQSHRHTHVMLGNEAAGYLAAEQLLKRTKGTLVCLGFDPRDMALERRNHAFCITLREAGRRYVEFGNIPIATEPVVEESAITASLARIVERIRDMDPPPAGLFCPSDRYTAMLYPLLKQAGLRPMEDFPIVSCANEITYLTGLDPRPITIDLAEQVVGRRAVEQLLSIITKPTDNQGESLALGAELILPPQLTADG